MIVTDLNGACCADTKIVSLYSQPHGLFAFLKFLARLFLSSHSSQCVYQNRDEVQPISYEVVHETACKLLRPTSLSRRSSISPEYRRIPLSTYARLPFRARIVLIASLEAIQDLYAYLAHPHFRRSYICPIFTTLTIRERNHPMVRLIQRPCRRQITFFLIPAGGRFGRFSWE